MTKFYVVIDPHGVVEIIAKPKKTDLYEGEAVYLVDVSKGTATLFMKKEAK